MGKRLHTLESLHNKIRERNYTPLFEKYGKYKAKYPVICPNGHKTFIIIEHFLNGTNCRFCRQEQKRFSIEKAKDVVINKGFIPLFNEYKNANEKLKILCKNGHVFEMPFSSINRGYGCLKCRIKNQRYTQQKVQQKLFSKGYELLSEYKGIRELIKVKCQNGHVQTGQCITFFKHLGCYRCRGSKPEIFSRNVLENLTGYEFPRMRPKWLRNPKSGALLELDGYCEKLKIAFEYNGRQHYETIEYWNDEKCNKLKTIEYNDSVKIEKCKERGIHLIILSGKIGTLKEQIINSLKNLEILL